MTPAAAGEGNPTKLMCADSSSSFSTLKRAFGLGYMVTVFVNSFVQLNIEDATRRTL
jgi:hypothetical protein